uniref:HDC14629 n=1 Tax=Drosophila melanogaster TaxID=7227 RepID=Q6IJL9_DROME|nr:TPA_inf: HDC14629 [Drosophila melanogaster]
MDDYGETCGMVSTNVAWAWSTAWVRDCDRDRVQVWASADLAYGMVPFTCGSNGHPGLATLPLQCPIMKVEEK